MAVMSFASANLGRDDLVAQIATNRHRWWALAAATAVVVAVVVGVVTGVIVTLVVGVAVGFGVGLVVAAGGWWGSAPLALALSGARAAGPVEQPRAHNLLDSLCAGAGAAKPGLAVVDDPSIDVMAVGRSPAPATVVVTSAMLARLTLVELEAVLAHAVVEIKAGATCPATVGAAGLGALAVLVPAAAGLADRIARASGDSTADLASVALTRYPPALVSALEKVLEAPRPLVPSPALARAIGHLWIARPQLEDRILALREL